MIGTDCIGSCKSNYHIYDQGHDGPASANKKKNIFINSFIEYQFFVCRNMWEDTLRDNLLNFASTAKGILLLQQTKAMNECMTYMYDRYKNKLQVRYKLLN